MEGHLYDGGQGAESVTLKPQHLQDLEDREWRTSKDPSALWSEQGNEAAITKGFGNGPRYNVKDQLSAASRGGLS